jgi:membrane protease YdiL (CAAX protease family)
VVGWDVPWINIVWIVLAAGLIVAASVLPPMRPLGAYFVVILTVLVLTTVVDPLIRGALVGDITPAGTDPQLRRLFAERILLAVEALAIIPVLAVLGYHGSETYLTLGTLTAPSGLRIGRRALSWAVVGPTVAILLVAATAAFANSMARPTPNLWSRALPLLPIARLAAALNAFAEEVLYRAGPLGPLARLVGPKAGIWILAVWFGLGHVYGGIPSGVTGFVMAGLLGLLFGKAMIDTHGVLSRYRGLYEDIAVAKIDLAVPDPVRLAGIGATATTPMEVGAHARHSRLDGSGSGTGRGPRGRELPRPTGYSAVF